MAEKALLRALKGETLATPPVWLMRQAGRYLPEYRAVRAQAGGFLDLCYNPDFAVEVTLQPIRRYGFDAAILFSDILVVPHALGQKLWFAEGEGPKLEPIRDAEGLKPLSRERFHERLAPVYETVRRLRRELPAETTLIGFAGAPWTVATYMVEGGGSKDFAHAKLWAYRDPAGFQALIDLLTDSTIEYLSAQVEAGAEALQLFDTWAGALPPEAFRLYAIEPARRIAAALLARHPAVPLIGFPRGAGMLYAEYAATTGVQGLGLDTAVPPDWAAAALQPKACLQGNIDPLLLAAGGEALVRTVRDRVIRLGGGPYIFNLGHGILPFTPPENVAALVEAVRRPT
ncbi:MAG TPA: uroporphyrinogen decarboxylase [Alphaproteobacteria bacterium]|nr:uroporphyrinogen decarboxylase [Alphaproteobacteria bacterium]